MSRIGLTSTGFGCNPASNAGAYNASGNTYIYMAIRRGTKVPESADEVFDSSLLSSTSGMEVNTNFPVDMLISTTPANTQDNWLNDRLRGSRLSGPTQFLKTNNTDVEYTFASGGMGFDNNSGFTQNWWSGTTDIYWSWKRAPGFFDVVAYTGNSTAGHTVSHNLGVVPEMMWIKSRNNTRSWRVYHSSFSNGSLRLNSEAAKDTSTNYFSTPTADNIILGTDNDTNQAYDYIAYLFASLPGISKVGSYTGNGTSQTIDCGFTSGARFVLLKVASTTDAWFLWDSVRGINAGAEPYLRLNTSSEETTTNDRIDPHPSGFAVDGTDTSNNKNGETYIFYAIA